jgi:hypothetical protein
MKRLAFIVTVVIAAAQSPARQPPGTVVVDALELPDEVQLLKDYKIPAASIVKFGDGTSADLTHEAAGFCCRARRLLPGAENDGGLDGESISFFTI